MESKLIRIIKTLLSRTDSGDVQWEDASKLTEGEKFIASVGDSIVELRGGTERSNSVDEYGKFWLRNITVQILNAKGLVVTEHEFTEDTMRDYEIVEKLFLAARTSARRTDAVLDSLLQKLGA